MRRIYDIHTPTRTEPPADAVYEAVKDAYHLAEKELLASQGWTELPLETKEDLVVALLDVVVAEGRSAPEDLAGYALRRLSS